MNHRKLIAALFLFSLFNLTINWELHAQSTTANNQTTESTATATTDTVAEVSLAKILPLAAALKEEALNIDSQIGAINNIEDLEKKHFDLQQKIAELQNKLSPLEKSKAFRLEQISELRTQIRQAIETSGDLAKGIAARMQLAEQLRQTWQSKKSVWASHKTNFSADTNETIRPIIKDSESLISKALKKLDGIETPLVEFQGRVVSLQQESQKLLQQIDTIMTAMRKDLFRRSRPAMFTPSFIREFDKTLWEAFWLGIATVAVPERSFFNTYGWIFGLQLILVFAFAIFFRRLNMATLEKLKLGFLVKRYLSAAILPGILLPMILLEEHPKLIYFIFTILIIVSAARLLAGMVESIWRRRLVYIVSGLYQTIQLFNMIALPAPFFRLFIAIIGLIGSIICFWRARVATNQSDSVLFFIAAKLGGLSMLLVFITQVAGYSQFSNHLLDIAIKTVFICLLAWMSALILRGSFEAAFDNKWVRKSAIINTHYRLFIKRISLLLEILTAFFALSAILSTWGVADTTLQASNLILQTGFSFQGNLYSIGLLTTAIIAIYLAMFSSWLIQRILDEEVYPRKKVERGVGISINRLIHYSFILVAISLGFSTLGIGMQNLTVIIGAFGIGIGFGLQNIVNNFASGLILLFERSVKVGDVVVINNEWGIIKNLGLRATVVETFNHSEMIVPNSDLVSTMVTNWTLTDRQVRIILKVGVAYGSDIDLVSKTLYLAAQNHPYAMKAPAPVVLFTTFGASSLDFELRVWVADIDNQLIIKDELNREIDRLFRENNIEIPFSQHDLHIRTMDKPFQESIQTLLLPEQKSEGESKTKA